MKNCSLYTAIKLFNALPEDLRTENYINSFTRGIAHIYPESSAFVVIILRIHYVQKSFYTRSILLSSSQGSF